MNTLKEAKIGDTVTVVKLHGEGAVKRRLMDMGITKGTQVHIRKVAPLGDRLRLRFAAMNFRLEKRMPKWLKYNNLVKYSNLVKNNQSERGKVI